MKKYTLGKNCVVTWITEEEESVKKKQNLLMRQYINKRIKLLESEIKLLREYFLRKS